MKPFKLKYIPANTLLPAEPSPIQGGTGDDVVVIKLFWETNCSRGSHLGEIHNHS